LIFPNDHGSVCNRIRCVSAIAHPGYSPRDRLDGGLVLGVGNHRQTVEGACNEAGT